MSDDFNIVEDLRNALAKSVQQAPANKLGPLVVAFMELGLIEDRRSPSRPLLLAKRVRNLTPKTKRAKLTCPVPGCVNSFSPRWGGYCSDHRNTAGFKAWKKQNAKAKAGK